MVVAHAEQGGNNGYVYKTMRFVNRLLYSCFAILRDLLLPKTLKTGWQKLNKLMIF